MTKTTILLTLLACCCCSCLKQHDDNRVPPPSGGGGAPAVYDWATIADSAELSLNYFWSASGKYYVSNNNSTEWAQYWPNAHALDVLTDAFLRNPSGSAKSRMQELVTGVNIKNGNTWINYYYDDMEWMALASLRAYVATNDIAYKNITDVLWEDIKKGWTSDLGGGIWWRKDNPSKNTPSNMPAAILAGRLYRLFKRPEDLDWAKKIYDWGKSVLFESASGLVYDNIDKSGNKNTTWKFTYNQGTFLGAGLELYKITNNSMYLDDAVKVADYTLNSGFLTAGGSILKDEGGGDGGLFKGIFIRYFTRLIVDGGLDTGKRNFYINFMKTNGENLWSKGTNKNLLLFGSAWDRAPGTTTDLTVQLSGAMLLEALAELKKAGLLN